MRVRQPLDRSHVPGELTHREDSRHVSLYLQGTSVTQHQEPLDRPPAGWGLTRRAAGPHALPCLLELIPPARVQTAGWDARLGSSRRVGPRPAQMCTQDIQPLPVLMRRVRISAPRAPSRQAVLPSAAVYLLDLTPPVREPRATPPVRQGRSQQVLLRPVRQ